jgi:hypothetical protein
MPFRPSDAAVTIVSHWGCLWVMDDWKAIVTIVYLLANTHLPSSWRSGCHTNGTCYLPSRIVCLVRIGIFHFKNSPFTHIVCLLFLGSLTTKSICFPVQHSNQTSANYRWRHPSDFPSRLRTLTYSKQGLPLLVKYVLVGGRGKWKNIALLGRVRRRPLEKLTKSREMFLERLMTLLLSQSQSSSMFR